MKRITIYFAILLFSIQFQPLQAQTDSIAVKIEQLEREKEKIISEEKAALKKAVEEINLRLEKKEINWEEAEQLKAEAAKKHALNIENRVAIIDNKIALLRREGTDAEVDWEWSTDEDEDEDDGEDDEDDWDRKGKYSRTTSHLILAAGFNNALSEDQSLNDSDFEVAGSRFFEIGIDWKTRVFEKSNWLRFRYGVSFQFNGLKPTDNRYFVEEGELTQLEEYPLELDKSKFRMDHLVVPVHFEFGPSKKIESAKSVWFSTEDQFRIGLGGYAGFNIGERQKLKYEEDGEDVKRKLKGSYNTNDFVYGLSGYIGWGDLALYGKYGLNNIFAAPNEELHLVSVGLKFEMD